MDLSAFAFVKNEEVEISRSRENLREHILGQQSAFTCLEQLRQPVIVAIQGGCIGGAVALVTACHICYCTADAMFSIEETNIGIACDVGSLQRLPHVISETNLRECVYTGDRLCAEKALTWGLVGQVFPDHQTLLDGANTLAKRIAEKSPLVLHGCKQSMNYNRDHSIQDGLDQIAL